jgi:hypothetical protein
VAVGEVRLQPRRHLEAGPRRVQQAVFLQQVSQVFVGFGEVGFLGKCVSVVARGQEVQGAIDTALGKATLASDSCRKASKWQGTLLSSE